MVYMKYFLIAICFLTTTLHGQVIEKNKLSATQKKETILKDTLLNTIQKLNKQNDQLTFDVKSQSSKIEMLIEKTETNRFDYFKDFIYPILLSIIAAIIFWFVFSFFPESRRRKKIRPKLDLDMYNVYTTLFFIFDLVMRSNNYSPSNFQYRIKGNKLSKEDIDLGLQNKCLNETYLYDNNVNKHLLVIGKSLFESASKIDLIVERLFNFSNYLTADEILLLEKIRKKLQVYELGDYNTNASTVIGGIELKPVNPSISYMSQNFFELYELFIKFQDIVYNNSYLDRDISISKVQHYYYSGQYNKCKNEIANAITKYPMDKSFLDFYSFLSEYNSGQRDISYIKLETILKNKPHLVSSRSFLSDLLQDKRVKELVEKYYTAIEIVELNAVIMNEDLLCQSYIDQANTLLKYYRGKTDNIKQKK
jgi:hypothetical protein